MSDPDTSVPRFNVHTADFDALPDGSGWMRLLFESPDGARKAGSFKEPGVHHEVMPYDEVLFAIAGSTTLTVEDGEPFELSAGDVCYLRKGQRVTFDNADDFHDLSIFMRYDEQE